MERRRDGEQTRRLADLRPGSSRDKDRFIAGKKADGLKTEKEQGEGILTAGKKADGLKTRKEQGQGIIIEDKRAD